MVLKINKAYPCGIVQKNTCRKGFPTDHQLLQQRETFFSSLDFNNEEIKMKESKVTA